MIDDSHDENRVTGILAAPDEAGSALKPIDLETTTRQRPLILRIASGTAKVVLPIAILAGGIAAFQALKASRPEVPQRPVREQVWTIETMPATFARHQPTLRLYGQTVAGRQVSLRALVGGEIVAVAPDLRVGAMIPEGTPLVRIDEFDYEGAVIAGRANLAEARARLREIEATIASEGDALRRAFEQLEIGRRDVERAEQLRATGAVTARTLDDRKLILSQREQAVEQRTNNLAIQEARAEQQRAAIARLDRQLIEAERNLENTTLVAPFSGYVVEENAEVGRLVSSNDVVVSLIDQADIEVAFTLSDRQYGRIVAADGSVIGRPVTVKWHVDADPITLTGTIARISPQIAAATGGVQVYAILDAGPGKDVIRPGAFVEVLVPDRSYDAVVSVPEAALYPGDQLFVMVDGRLEGREVDVVGFSGRDVLVRGALADGDRVMLTKITAAGNGLKVREAGEAAPAEGRPPRPAGAQTSEAPAQAVRQ